MGEMTSAAIPPPTEDDHPWGEGEREAIVYFDLSCPNCALCWHRVRDLPLRLWLRHFPLASKRPRGPALHAAAEAAGAQGFFGPMWDSLLGRSERTDDPHLWARAKALDLDLVEFDRVRRSPQTEARVRRDLESAIRGGVTSSPAAVIDGRLVMERMDDALRELAERG